MLPSLHLPVIALAGILAGLGLYYAGSAIGMLAIYLPAAIALLLVWEISRVILRWVPRLLPRADRAAMRDPATPAEQPLQQRRIGRSEITIFGAMLLCGLGLAYLILGPITGPLRPPSPTPLSETAL
ncbi:hypothetical protein BFP70_00310 [Thioclava sp. SK-1]|uniref:hypothetical protein n=1 Tax=Thioclava sp. SK-1 TaxID=1889770 RepID=UPI0008240AEF|nr:hypothetical protein [Thioclava sp. SK-1]OCX66646.1 hypothetical protein BFP70_00310 [Thioclava sp. SK-1]